MPDYYRQLNFFIDATMPEWYIESESGAALLAANVKNISFGELVRASFQLTDGEPVFNSSGVLQNPWTAFAGSEAVSEVVIDNNFNWWDDCHLHTAITAGTAIATIAIDNLAAVPRALGSIRLSASDIVHYNAYTKQGSTYTFTLADESFDTASFTPASSYDSGAAVRIIEMPVIVSAENAGIPATGYFAGTLDAANPVYEALIEGLNSISSTQLELSIFVSGRAVFRSRVIFDCLSALNPGEGTDYLRPNVWTAADSRYIQFANLSTTAAALPAGSDPTAEATVTGELVNIQFGIPAGQNGITPHIGSNNDWYVGDTDTGVLATINGSYIEFSAVDSSGNYTMQGDTTIPAAVLTSAGNLYPVERGSITVDTVNHTVTFNVAPYLAYDNAAAFSGTWRLYLAAYCPSSDAAYTKVAADALFATQDNTYTKAAADALLDGKMPVRPGSIEFKPTVQNGGIIDFHFAGSEADYTARITEVPIGHIDIVVPEGADIVTKNGDGNLYRFEACCPLGSIILTPRSYVSGFLTCNGAAVSRTTYNKLFNAIGTAFGTGDGSTTFNLPDITSDIPGTRYLIRY